MATNQILILSMVFGFTGLGGWAVYERAGKHDAEAEVVTQKNDVTSHQQDLAILQTKHETTQAQSKQLAHDLENISLKNIRVTLQQRTEVDNLLEDKVILQAHIDALKKKIEEHQWTTNVLDKTLSKTAVERNKLKDTLNAERNNAYQAQVALKKKLQAASREEKKSIDQLKQFQNERVQLEKGVAQQNTTIRSLTDEVNRLSQEIRNSVAERDAAIQAAQNAQSRINTISYQDQQYYATIHALKHKLVNLDRVHREDYQAVQTLQVKNQSLINKVLILHREISRLKGLLAKPTRSQNNHTHARIATLNKK